MPIQQELPRALKFTRTIKGLKQNELAAGYTQQMYSLIENGQRELAPEMAAPIASKIDDPQLHSAIQRQFTGGVGAAWLDGEYASDDVSSVAIKSIEELEEAIDAIKRIPFFRNPQSLDSKERQKIYSEMLQIHDAWVALYNLNGRMCRTYGFSMIKLCEEHDRKLQSRRYVRAH